MIEIAESHEQWQAIGAKRTEPVARQPWQQHHKAEEITEEDQFERVDGGRQMADHRRHGGEERSGDDHQQGALERIVADRRGAGCSGRCNCIGGGGHRHGTTIGATPPGRQPPWRMTAPRQTRVTAM
jgi:hypothetical protein